MKEKSGPVFGCFFPPNKTSLQDVQLQRLVSSYVNFAKLVFPAVCLYHRHHHDQLYQLYQRHIFGRNVLELYKKGQ